MNLLDETKGAISQSEHSTDDVRFVCIVRDYKTKPKETTNE